MSDTADQPDPKQAVEAQLCAYLEGDLSPAELAGIEQHLAAHAQHRALLADLAKQRQWLRDVPREAAPAEVAEPFQLQVERSMLLGEDRPSDLASAPAMSPGGGSRGQWSQVGVMAALLLLTGGMGVVISVMIAGPGRGRPRFAVDAPAPAPAEVTPAPPAAAALPSPGRPAARMAAAAPPVRAADLQNADSVNLATNDERNAAAPAVAAPEVAPVSAGGPTALADRVVTMTPVSPTLPSAIESPARTVHLVVTTSDPAAISTFLARSGLTPEPATVATQAATADALAQGVVPSQQQRQLQQQQQMGGAPPADAAAARRSPAVGSRSRTPAAASGFVAATPPPSPLPAATVPPRRYVIRGLTTSQVRQLTADLSVAAAPGRVATLADGPTPAKAVAAAPATAPAARPIGRGETVTVVIPQLTGPGVTQSNAVRVADDGTIALPMVEPIPAAGATPAEVARRVADRYRQANLIPRPTVTVTAGAAADATLGPIAGGNTVMVDVQPAAAGRSR